MIHGWQRSGSGCRFWILLLIVLTLLQSPVAEAKPLRTLPLGERWFTIRLQGELVGFGRQVIRQTHDGYEISAESGVKLMVLGFTREATSREHYQVGHDFALQSFSVEQVIDRAALNLSGTVSAKGISATVTTNGSSREQVLPVKGAVYPSALVNLYPLSKGATPGKKYVLQVFDPEAVKVKKVTITAIGPEPMGQTSAYHFRNDLYPFVANDVWVDSAGNTLRESVREGLVETVAESAAVARQALLTAAVAKKDLVLDFSLIRLNRPLARHGQLTRLVVELSGYPLEVPLVTGPGQRMERVQGGRVRFVRELGSETEVAEPPGGELLRATARLPVDNPEIAAQLREVLGGEREPLRQVEKLSAWVANYVNDAITDGQTALDTLASREGNCVSHARLFVTLARAAGLPSRLAVGLVYASDKGFLYHAWAEVYANGWLAVDPTFNQVPADLTHLKLAEGEAPEDFAAVAGLIGNVAALVVETSYGQKP